MRVSLNQNNSDSTWSMPGVSAAIGCGQHNVMMNTHQRHSQEGVSNAHFKQREVGIHAVLHVTRKQHYMSTRRTARHDTSRSGNHIPASSR